MTNHWRDFKNSDVILVIGANPAENHPCGWKWAHVGRDERGTQIIHVDPRFTRTSAIADVYAPIRAGTDVAFFGGLINYVLQNKLYHEDYVKLHTNAAFVVASGYQFNDGLFSGYDEAKRTYDPATWDYERVTPTGPAAGGQPAGSSGGAEALGPAAGAPSGGTQSPVAGGTPAGGAAPAAPVAYAKTDPTLQDPRSVFQLMKAHYARYTPEKVSEITGMPVEKFTDIAKRFGATGTPDKVGSVVYAVGLTHHTTGVQIIRGIGLLQLLLGNVGRPGGGVNAERGHANIQGNTDNAVSWEIFPGYLAVAKPGMNTMADYMAKVPAKASAPNAVNYFGTNYKKFMVSMLKAWYGDAAQPDNDFRYSWLPKPGKNSSWLTIHDEARSGTLDGLFAAGMSGLNIGPDSKRMSGSMGKLKWLVVMDPLPTATSEFWRAPGVDPKTINTEVYFFPATHWIEKDGSFVNSGRWAQWKWKVLDAPGQVKDDNWILGQLFLRLKALYAKEGGTLPDPILNLKWDYAKPENPSLDEIAQEINGFDLTTGKRVSSFATLKDDGTTSAGNWLYSGSYPPEGNLMQRRGTSDPTGLGYFHDWAWAWPANRRILYNRASADANGQPWDKTRPGIRWNGTAWVGDIPDFPATSPPAEGKGSFIMTGEGVARLFAPGALTSDGPFPEHYEPMESPVHNAMSKVQNDPAVFLYKDAKDTFAAVDSEFPYVATTYRVTEHEHYVTQNVPYLVESMPDFFVELPVELAEKKGITNGGKVKVRSKRGEVIGIALVTKRMRPLKVAGKTVYQVGIPVHWHFAAGKGTDAAAGKFRTTPEMANILTPYVGDANVRTPEFKGFLVDVEK
ncbi:MAG: formate dehydrogenase major subunit, partial [Actinomycetota bacterium]|nr:formate dehydrogenase major subunit [Actinomycetota bacterium]